MTGPWRSFVALGDSLTEGVGDPLPGRGLRGWAARLADGLRRLEPSLEFTNLAKRSLISAEIRDLQLSRALALKPDLAGVIVGMNDAIRPEFAPENVEEPLEEMVAALTGAGALVLMATLPDITRILPLPKRMTRGVHQKLEAVSGVVRSVAGRYQGTLLVDASDSPEELRRANWSLDQLHPNSRGHQLIALGFAERLGARANVTVPMAPAGRVRAVGIENARHAQWLLDNWAVPEAKRLASKVAGRAARP
jgi:lysophospholipase L1-like esterase